MKPGHDGAAALLTDDRLDWSLEAEKDSHDRHSALDTNVLFDLLARAPRLPDIIGLGGWHKILPGGLRSTPGGYHGLDPGVLQRGVMLGQDVTTYHSSHERSHLFNGVAMSPFDPSSDLAILVWEGVIGALYHWSDNGATIERTEVLSQPGARYSALFSVASPTFPDSGAFPPSEHAGKLMALVGLADGESPSQDAVWVVESLLGLRSLYPFDKARYRRSSLYNVGVRDPAFCRAAEYLSDRLFETFLKAAHETFEPGLPLVVVGGCGLNCDWNTRWRDSGLFRSVFVPPCANDSGSAIGTAVDASVQAGGSCTIEWDVYRGAEFVHDLSPHDAGWAAAPLDRSALVRKLGSGSVVAWVQGRCEIGPRALGNRSLLAAATREGSKAELNRIKQREDYRPIAPVCRQEELERWFGSGPVDPHMLYFRTVEQPDRIPAVTHTDGTARVQSVSHASNAKMHDLLTECHRQSGVGVLCNTSLNFLGKGFINRMSDLLHYCDWVGIDDVVVDDQHLTRSGHDRSGRST